MSSMLTLAGNAAPTGFYDFPIEQSLRFEDGDSAYLSRTPASAGNRKTWTLSMWFKRANLGGGKEIFCAYIDNNNRIIMRNNGDTFEFQQQNGGTQYSLVPSMQFRDVSAWYHLVYSCDTTQATAANRVKIYINGEQITSFSTEQYPAQNQDSAVNSTGNHYLGTGEFNSAVYSNYFDGYMADVNLIDGQALDPTSFGETKSGIWIPKDTAGLTFGTNGFRLAFADSAVIGDDTSGNTNDFTANNLVASDVVLDSPTNNFCTYNPNSRFGGNGTFSEGNLRFSGNSSGDMSTRTSTVIPAGMKFYFEAIYSEEAGSGGQARLGIDQTGSTSEREKTGTGLFSFDFRGSAGVPQAYDENTVTTYGSQPAEGDVVGIAVDLENGKLYAHKANSYYNSGDPAAGTGAVITGIPDLQSVVFMSIDGGVNRNNWHINFGQDSTFAGRKSAGGNADENGLGDFAYAPPSGFLSLCSANLPSGAIDTLNDETPEDYFNTVLYTGDGNTGRTVTGVGFSSSPDFVWIKERSSTSSHILSNAIAGSTKLLSSNTTDAEATDSNKITSFDSDGYTLGSSGAVNQSGQTYVGWNWKANGTGVSNTDGSITSTVSVGATSQQNWFSVVGYTGNGTAGATVGHSLQTAPSMVIIKWRTGGSTQPWVVYHTSTGNSAFCTLNTTNSSSSLGGVGVLNNTTPSSSVITLGDYSGTNLSGATYIAYCFANAEGLCKVGSYTGNGSTDGTFVFTGHRPAFLITKHVSTGNWAVWDNRRDPENVVDNLLYPNLSNAQNTGTDRFDFLSNGFKCKNTNDVNAWNASGVDYLFLSIAEQPFKYANAR